MSYNKIVHKTIKQHNIKKDSRIIRWFKRWVNATLFMYSCFFESLWNKNIFCFNVKLLLVLINVCITTSCQYKDLQIQLVSNCSLTWEHKILLKIVSQQLLYKIYRQVFTRQISFVILDLCCRNTLCVWNMTYLTSEVMWQCVYCVYCANSTFYCCFYGWGTCSTTQKCDVHMHSFAALPLWGHYIALMNFNQPVLPTLTSSRTWSWTFLFFDFVAFTFKIWFYNSVGPNLQKWLEQSLCVISHPSVRKHCCGWWVCFFFYLNSLFYYWFFG